MYHIVFEYRDNLSKGKWRKQECFVRSVKECKEIYGLGVDCEYRFILIEKAQEKKDGKQT